MIAMFYIVSYSCVQIFYVVYLAISDFLRVLCCLFLKKACVKVVYMTPWLSCWQWAFVREVSA